ncbi:uncharacterized protein LOC127092031 [Lathyrus oleraceus]|uniref:uncharacterized protein LOC127092031 n=1 Tax=Pisum sativum TaxID=3888 RepID=UPI0021D16FBD|nr:uncharacterized protein LOC127092031 [Pisum sativum]
MGNARAKRVQLQALRTEFVTLRMKTGELVTDYLYRTMAVANKMRVHGEKMEDVKIVEKILRSMTPKFNFVVCSIEESKNIDELTFDELQSSLSVHEQKIIQQDTEEQALKASNFKSSDIGKGKWKDKNPYHKSDEDYASDTRKGNNYRQFRGNKTNNDKSKVECFRCHRYGHYKSECRTKLHHDRGQKSNYVEEKKKIFLS